ncbi:hypothetical protein BU24DRAFT_497592 [Aaosphaeria arxii CBS 175.79]|uniref:Uncharacterized protein n=1 Tax=Aaosphaeria arxii CBS 175.79 TaxID=1450172 RepID=A0A6A5X805_9PLEO|nr:uncharacterized protein BU24DRAFT_497592 [Aaosphaeria arxii CBS 175.79]KAF2009029.1 hypothetical protein BU24DRAFT_497592 [Aaosphaeria arxii CBS 175.79]
MLSYERYYRDVDESGLALTPSIDNQVWFGDRSEQSDFLEALTFAKKLPNGSLDHPSHSCRYGFLSNSDILSWVHQSGTYVPMNSDPNAMVTGGVRLLILERALYQPSSYPIKQETFREISSYFRLPASTLIALSPEAGYLTHTLGLDPITGSPDFLTIILKTPQKFQVGNYGLAITHDFTTGISTGILHGTGVIANANGYSLWRDTAGIEILDLLKEVQQEWTLPLCLPTVLLNHHILRTDYFCSIILGNQHTELQSQLGTTRAGRLAGRKGHNIATEKPFQQAKVNLRDLTVGLSSLLFDIIWFCSVTEWQCEAVTDLDSILVELSQLATGNATSNLQTRSTRAKVRHLTSLAKGLKRQMTAMKEVGQADMSVLYSITSQADSRLSAKMAAASSRDSAAMKTLAFLTTLFLPGTAVATIFSMDMFNWRPSSPSSPSSDSEESKVVAELFWVYWAVTVPLTIVVAVGWRIWWGWEKKHFDEDVRREIEAIDGEGRQESLADDDSLASVMIGAGVRITEMRKRNLWGRLRGGKKG